MRMARAAKSRSGSSAERGQLRPQSCLAPSTRSLSDSAALATLLNMSLNTIIASARPRLSSLAQPSPACFLSTSAYLQAAWSGRGSQSNRPKPKGRFNKGVFEEDSSPRQASWDADEEAGPRGGRVDEDGFPVKPRKAPRKKMPRNPPPPGPPSAEEMDKRHRMRVARAERLERMDLTAQLTPQKTCELRPPAPSHRRLPS